MRTGAIGLALLLASVAAPAARAADHVVVKPATQVFPFLKEYYGIDPAMRSRFSLAYRVADHGRTAPVRLSVAEAAGETVLDTTPDGWLTRLPSPAAMARAAPVRLEAPEGVQAQVQLVPEATVRPAPVLEMAEVRASADQLASALRRFAGPLSLVLPHFTRVLFSGAEGAEAVDADGRATPLPLFRNTPVLELAKSQDVRQVRFAKPPYHVLLAPPARSNGK